MTTQRFVAITKNEAKIELFTFVSRDEFDTHKLADLYSAFFAIPAFRADVTAYCEAYNEEFQAKFEIQREIVTQRKLSLAQLRAYNNRQVIGLAKWNKSQWIETIARYELNLEMAWEQYHYFSTRMDKYTSN